MFNLQFQIVYSLLAWVLTNCVFYPSNAANQLEKSAVDLPIVWQSQKSLNVEKFVAVVRLLLQRVTSTECVIVINCSPRRILSTFRFPFEENSKRICQKSCHVF